MNSIPESEDLAPYLRQKLERDKEYTWQTAPYIHEEVREALREVEYSVRSLSYTPVRRHGYSDLLNIYDYNANGYNSSAYLQMEMQRQIDAAQMQINIYVAANIDVPRGCCLSVAVENTSGQAINFANANLIVERVA